MVVTECSFLINSLPRATSSGIVWFIYYSLPPFCHSPSFTTNGVDRDCYNCCRPPGRSVPVTTVVGLFFPKATFRGPCATPCPAALVSFQKKKRSATRGARFQSYRAVSSFIVKLVIIADLVLLSS
jgi:hypothetical protein